MTSNRFFVSEDRICFPVLTLDGAEHHHIRNVIRIRVGEKAWIFDEKGSEYLAKVERIDVEQTRLRILEHRLPLEKGPRFTLAMSLLKSRNWEWILQKGTEMGIDAVIPILTDRCVVRISSEAETGKLERWGRIARSAAKQSGRSRVPQISRSLSLGEFLNRRVVQNDFVLMEKAPLLLKDRALAYSQRDSDQPEAERDITILVGPEGGWTNREAKDILRQGFEAVSLGDNILRAETAALCGLAVLIQFWKK